MNGSTETLIRFATIAGIVLLLYIIWAIIWRALYLPVKMKDEHIKEKEAAKNDLLEIQAAKAIEWDKYKELQDELDTMRKAHFKEKEANAKLREERASLLEEKERLVNYNKKMKENNKKDK